MVVDNGSKMTVAFDDDAHGCFDLVDHDLEVAPRRLAFFTNSSFDHLKPVVHAVQPLIDTAKSLVVGGEPFVDSFETIDHGSVQLLEACSCPLSSASRRGSPGVS
jgi:hypothetical protein